MTTTYDPARSYRTGPLRVVSTDDLIRSLDPNYVPVPNPAPRHWSDDLGLARWIAEATAHAVTTRQTYQSTGA
jgi:hypothetical protein